MSVRIFQWLVDKDSLKANPKPPFVIEPYIDKNGNYSWALDIDKMIGGKIYAFRYMGTVWYNVKCPDNSIKVYRVQAGRSW